MNKLTTNPSTNSDIPSDLVLIGHIRDAFGIQGWVKIFSHSNNPQSLLNAKIWWLQTIAQKDMAKQNVDTPPNPGSLKAIEISQTKVHTDHIVALFKGCSSRTQAETYKGQQIWISRADFPQTDEDEYYWVDLIGMQVLNQQGESLGIVTELSDNGAHDILHVSQTNATIEAEEKPTIRLIPYVDAYVLNIDDEKKQILVDWGLDY